MIRKEEQSKILMEMYEKMYKEAEPAADLKTLIETGETSEPNWFLKYYLPEDRIKQIVEEVCDKHKITRPNERQMFLTTVLIGASPTSEREVWEKQRKQKGETNEEIKN